jgi:hypothetical protein
MSEIDIDAIAHCYVTVHGDFAGLHAALVADRHYANGEMGLFKVWLLVTNRVNELLPEGWREELH